MSKMQRTKGKSFEREIVNLAKGVGLEAKRTAPMQAGYGANDDSDVLIAGLKVECKHWATIPQWKKLLASEISDGPFKPGKVIREMLHGHNALILKQTRGCTLVLDGQLNVWTLTDWLAWVCTWQKNGAPAGTWPVYDAHNNPTTEASND